MTQVIHTVDVHAEGEPGRIVMGQHLRVQGSSMQERLAWCAEHLDDLRRVLLTEPRGHPAMCAVLVLPPVTARADVGIVVLEQGGFRPMSGSNTMCAVTALLETGALPITGPETTVRIDTAVGLVEALARCEGSRVRSVQVRNVPSFAYALDTPVVVPDYGTVLVDVAFGGQFYAQAPAASLGVQLGRENAREVLRAGAAMLAATRAQVEVSHPEQPDVRTIALAMLHGPAQDAGVSARNHVILPNGTRPLDPDDPDTWGGSLDRSPCGTGTSARMAALHARGELGLETPFVHQGILGTTFTGMLHEVTTVGGLSAVIPSIEGRAWISGLQQFIVADDDPFPAGYTVPDVWAD